MFRKWLLKLMSSRVFWSSVALVGLVVGSGIWYNREYLDDVVTSDATKQSRVGISVGTPTVHTRERLLNDRFEQVAWLDDELKNTRPTMPEPATTAKSTPAADPPSSPAAAKESDAQRLRMLDEMTEQLRYGADDPRKPFEMMNGYRDVLRAERARAMLDDRHDMDDDTLDLFSFDTTVMPRDGMRGSAAIEVLLTRDPSELLDDVPGRRAAETRFADQKYKDLFDTYVGWLEKVRTVQHSSLATLTRTLESVDGWKFNSSDYELLLRRSACSELLRSPTLVPQSRDERREAAGTRRNACRATLTGTTPWDLWERSVPRSSPEPDEKAYDAMRAIDRMLAAVRVHVLTRLAATSLEQLRRGQDLTRDEIAQAAADPNAAILAAYVQASPRGPEEIAADCIAQPPGPVNAIVPMLPPWIVGAVKQVFPELGGGLDFDCTTAPKNLPLRTLVALIDKLERHDPAYAVTEPNSTPKWVVDVVPGVALSDRDLDGVMMSCVAASLIEENAVRPTAEQPRNHGASLTKFFEIRVDRLVSGCAISVAPKVSSLRLPDDISKPAEILPAVTRLLDQQRLLDSLDFLLEGPGYSDRPDAGSADWPASSAYGYSLSPRLRQNVEIRRDARISADLDTSQASGRFKRNRELDYRGIEPEVVGFMRATQAERPRRGARFGWLLTPQPGKEDTYSVPLEQAELGAVVALPSWWRSALLQVCTRFVSQANMGGVFTDAFWNHQDQCRVEMIRLPGSSLEVSRRLGMDVLTTPYMDAWDAPPMLLAGVLAEATQLVITGERLWRNTVVTLGGQKADRIEVLPDMVGIAATFKCIRKPTMGVLTGDQGGLPPPGVAPIANGSAPRGDPAPKPAPPPEAGAGAGAGATPIGAVSPVSRKDPAPKPEPPPRPSETPSAPSPVAASANGVVKQDPPPMPAPMRLTQTYAVPVTVWTSEGHTAPQQANVVVDAGTTYKPCLPETGDEKLSP